MELKENQILYNDWLHLLRKAARGNKEALEELEITQLQALEMLKEEDDVAYNNTIFYLISLLQEKKNAEGL